MWARHGVVAGMAVLVAAVIVGSAAVLGRPAETALAGLIGVAALAVLVTALTIRSVLARPNAAIPAAMDELEARLATAADERLEMQLRAETAGRFREEFVASVRHELKTPLNSILGFTGVLLQEVDGPLTPQQREDVEAIRAAGLYLEELVAAVLDEWEPERDDSLGLREVDLAEVVRDVARLLAGQVADKPVRLETHVAEGLLPLFADPRRLRQILINLGTNAIRATSRGAVTIEVALAPNDGVRITVRDTGRGVAPANVDRLFGEFEQLGPPQSRAGGTGLGLALTKEMVEWHGGHVEVESTPGVGTAFHVVLPREAD